LRTHTHTHTHTHTCAPLASLSHSSSPTPLHPHVQSALAAAKEHDQWFKLVPRQWKDKIKGDVHVSLKYVESTKAKSAMAVDDFELLQVLGKGSFGKVMLVRKKDTSRMYAMKILSKSTVISRDEVEHTRAEQRVLGRINHPFIVGLKFSFQSPKKLYLVLDMVNGGELFFHLQNEVKFSPERARFYTAELVLALEYLHKLEIVYRDLKPENILIDQYGHICITDFGLCKEDMGAADETKTFCGTAEYLAPEVLKGDGYGKAVDWWSLGILLFEMLTGLPPFYSDNTNLMYKKIMYSDLKFPAEVPEAAQSLIEMLLQRNPAERLGTGEDGADKIKAHPYFEGINWEELYDRNVMPPWKPEVSGDKDVSNFAPEFTTMAAVDSVVEGSVLSNTLQDQFKGFTFTDSSELAAAE
jgi:serine/threonine protein kinase